MYPSSPHTIHPPHIRSAILGESVINTGFRLCDGSDSEGEVEDASISPTLSHAEAPELQNISGIAESIKTQEDFLTSIYEEVSGRFPDLSFAMSCASVNSDTQIPVLTINQCHLFVHPPYGMVSHIQGYVQYKMFCNLGASAWLSVGLILAFSISPSLSLPSHN